MALFIGIMLAVIVFAVVYDRVLSLVVRNGIRCTLSLDRAEGREGDVFTLTETVTVRTASVPGTVRVELHLPDFLEFVGAYLDSSDPTRHVTSELSEGTSVNVWKVRALRRGTYSVGRVLLIRRSPFGQTREEISLTAEKGVTLTVRPAVTEVAASAIPEVHAAAVLLNVQSRSREKTLYAVAYPETVDSCVRAAQYFLEHYVGRAELISNGKCAYPDEYAVPVRGGSFFYSPTGEYTGEFVTNCLTELSCRTEDMLKALADGDCDFPENIVVITAYVDDFIVEFCRAMTEKGKTVSFITLPPKSFAPSLPEETPVTYFAGKEPGDDE